jgi:hypothetical protein
MDKKTVLAGMLGLVEPGMLKAMSAVGPHYGRKALVGQHKVLGKDRYGHDCMVDQSEKINFRQSKYIPGNGAHHRLGKNAGE